MKQNIVNEWSDILSKKLKRSAIEISTFGLRCDDFNPDYVEVFFEDDSYCKFNYAFAVENKEKQQVAIFTEHCGYHIFSNDGVTVTEIKGLLKTVVVQCEW